MLKQFNIGITWRLGAIVFFLLPLVRILGQTEWLFTQLILGVLVLIFIGNLYFYLQKTNRDLERFLLAIEYEDISLKFPEKDIGSGFGPLYKTFQKISTSLNARLQHRNSEQTLNEILVEKANLGFLVAAPDGKIIICNKALQNALGIPKVSHLTSLKNLIPKLYPFLDALEEGESGKGLELAKGRQLQVKRFDYELHQRNYQLFVFQNIREIRDDVEMEAWAKLIRTLTHEIMNSVNTIESLSETARQLLLSQELEELQYALEVLHSRAQGLLKFVDKYRKVTHVKAPVKEYIPVNLLIDEAIRLRKTEWQKRGIEVHLKVDSKITISIDKGQIIQVLLNIFLNSEHAVKDTVEPLIQIEAFREDGFIYVQITDNGKGISPRDLQSVFTPFFTTRNDGSGIGLSLARQIMRQHQGSIFIGSKEGVYTKVSLKFP